MASTFVDEAIAANKVVVFSKTTCPFCSKAKSALRSIGAEFEVYEIERRPGAWKVFISIFLKILFQIVRKFKITSEKKLVPEVSPEFS